MGDCSLLLCSFIVVPQSSYVEYTVRTVGLASKIGAVEVEIET